MSNENRRVLVIDSGGETSSLIEGPLESERFDPIFAQSAADGLAVAVSIQPSVILLDADLSDANCMDVCKRLKEMPETESIPVLLIAEGLQIGNYTQALDIGAVDFLVKPFHPIELTARVRSAWRSKRLATTLDRVAQIDELTGMRNRAYIVHRYQEEFERARRYGIALGVVLIVVDDYQKLCSDHGVGFADMVLMDVAARLRGIIRSSDTHGRCGSAEFLVLLPGQGLDGTAHFADRCRKEISQLKFAHLGADIHVTCSCGVATIIEDPAQTASLLIESVEKAVAAAQAFDKNCVFAWDGNQAVPYQSDSMEPG